MESSSSIAQPVARPQRQIPLEVLIKILLWEVGRGSRFVGIQEGLHPAIDERTDALILFVPPSTLPQSTLAIPLKLFIEDRAAAANLIKAKLLVFRESVELDRRQLDHRRALSADPVRNTDRRQAGFALLMEMLVVCVVLLILAAAAIPNLIQVAHDQQISTAKSQVHLVFSANAAIAVCAQTPNCRTLPATAALIPSPGSITMGGYTFVYASTSNGWSYTAAPIVTGFGQPTITATESGVTCAGVPC